jgi:hypothetical protein
LVVHNGHVYVAELLQGIGQVGMCLCQVGVYKDAPATGARQADRQTDRQTDRNYTECKLPGAFRCAETSVCRKLRMSHVNVAELLQGISKVGVCLQG